MSESQIEIGTITSRSTDLQDSFKPYRKAGENFLEVHKPDRKSADDSKTKITTTYEGSLVAPQALKQGGEVGKDSISMIKSELASMEIKQQKQKAMDNEGKLKNTEAHNNYQLVKKLMLPQDRKGRVHNFGGVCNEALQELEKTAGDPASWTAEDMKKPEVNALLACYQGFEDLRDNRTMHGYQTRALEWLAGRQQEINALKPTESIDHQKQLKDIVEAFGRGIGSEEIPYYHQINERVPWVKAENLKPQHAANLLALYKDGLSATDKSRYAPMKVIDVDESGSAIPDYRVYEEEKKKQKSYLQTTIDFIADWFNIIISKVWKL